MWAATELSVREWPAAEKKQSRELLEKEFKSHAEKLAFFRHSLFTFASGVLLLGSAIQYYNCCL